ncbi:MAG TPA: hypothetical protein VKS79_11320 [Gemmataceae bacterium]|nr:hypothetical protein [Gemmataceae bacterium]
MAGNRRVGSVTRKRLQLERLDERILPDAAAMVEIWIIVREQQLLAASIRADNAAAAQANDPTAQAISASLASTAASSSSAAPVPSTDPSTSGNTTPSTDNTANSSSDSSTLASTSSSSTNSTSTSASTASTVSTSSTSLATSISGQKTSDSSAAHTSAPESNANNADLTDAMATAPVKSSDIRSMVENMPMSVAALYPYLSAQTATAAIFRSASETDCRLPGLITGSNEASNSALEHVDTSPVRSLRLLLKPLPAFKQFSANESEIMSTPLDALTSLALPAKVPISPAEIAGGFVSEFSPFDPAALDERLQQFLTKLYEQPHASEGGGRFGNLAMLSAAVLGGMVGMQLIRRHEKTARRRDLSTKSLRWTATKMN